ncbi:MAG: hypothetical protein ACJAXS_002545 [Colwellia sp.]|jgi:hypothetical protein
MYFDSPQNTKQSRHRGFKGKHQIHDFFNFEVFQNKNSATHHVFKG